MFNPARLALARRRQKLTKKALAEIVGCDVKTLVRYENGDAAPSDDSAQAMARALGFPAPGTYKEFQKLTSMAEPEGVPPAQDMIRLLVQGQEAVIKTARSIAPIADKASDEPTLDLLTQRMQVHEKTAWMLRSLLEG